MADSIDGHDEAFDRIVQEYYQAVENGQRVDAKVFIDQHPEFKDELESFFADLDNLGDYWDKRARSETLDATPTNLEPRAVTGGPGASLEYIGEYRILEEIARGGMGVVFKARQEKLRRTVALKMILSGRVAGAAEVDRFQREARAAAAIKHPNIVGVHEIGVHDGQHYFTMDYVESDSLRQRLREGPLTPQKAAELIETLARATHFAHTQGIIHRDLKPANVLVDSNEQPHITDFGLAKPLADFDDVSQTDITRSGQIIGTPSYMAPEQAAAKYQLVGIASDIYSLGAMLYACLSGRAPFVAESTAETIRQVIHDEPVPTSVLNPRVPKDLETICLKCLSKEPHRRYGTAEDLADDLLRFQEGRPVVARPISRISKVHRWAKRNPWIAATAALLLLIALASPPTAIHQYRQSTELAAKAGKIQTQRDEIAGLLSQANAESRRNRRLLYIADMQRMAEEYGKANIGAMREMLLRHIPEPGKQDLRDFEWYYWRGKCDSQSVSWNHDDPVECLEVSPDGQIVASCSHAGHNTAFQIRDAQTGRLENEFVLPGLRVSAIQFRNNLELVVAARGQQEVVLVVNRATGEIERKLLSFPTNQTMPGSHFTFSRSGGLVARSFMGKVRCYDTSNAQSLKIRLPAEADEERYRSKGVIHRDQDGRYIEFAGQVSGATQTRIGSGVMQYDPEGAPQAWQTNSDYAPGIERDGGPVFSLAFSSSEDLLAAGTREGRIRLWQLSGGNEPLDFAAHDGVVWAIAFSEDNRLLATAGEDGLVKVWDVTTADLLHELVGHSGDVSSLAFRKGGFLVSGGVDRLLNIWQLPNRHPVTTLRGNEAAITAVRLSQGFFWTAGADKRVRKWPAARQTPPIVVADPAPFESVDISADNKFVAASGLRNGVSVWNLEAGGKRFLATPHNAINYPIYHVRVHDQSVWGLRWDGSLFHWNLETGRRELRKKYRVSLLSLMPQAAISPDGSKVAVQHKGGKVTIDSTANTDAPTLVLPTHDESNVFIKFSLDGKAILTNAMIESKDENDRVSLQLWNANTGQLVADVSRARVYHSAASNNGRVCYFEYPDNGVNNTPAEGSVVVWDQTDQQEFGRYSFGAVKGLAISPDGRHLAVVHADDHAEQGAQHVSIRRAVDGSEIHRLAIPTPRHVSFSSDGAQLIVAGKHGRIELVDVQTGQIRNSLVNPAGRIKSVAYAPDDTKIAVTFANRSSVGSSVISLQSPVIQESSMILGANIVSKTPAIYLPNGELTSQGLAWQQCDLSPDLKTAHKFGKRTGYLPETIARAAHLCFFLAPDQTLFRCDLTKSANVQHTSSPLAVNGVCGAMATTNDGRLIAMAFANEIQIYDGSSLKQLRVVENANGEIQALTFSDDGMLLASGGLDGVIELWKTDDWSLQTTVFSHSKRISCLRFTRLGQTIVSASEDGAIVLSDVITGSPKTTFGKHDGAVRWIEFSTDGDELASAGDDGVIYRWLAKTPRE